MIRVALFGLAALVAALLVALVAGPPLARRKIEEILSSAPGYQAEVADVGLALGHGAARIEGVTLRKPELDPPFLVIHRLEVRPAIREWLRGHRVVDLRIDGLEVNPVIGSSEARTQTGVDPEWVAKTLSRFPATVDQLTIRDGTIRYRDRTASPDVVLTGGDLEIDGSNLANRAGSQDELFGHVEVRGRVMSDGRLTARIDLDPYAEAPRFALVSELRQLPLVQIDDALRAYGQLDASAGTLDVVTRLRAEDGRFTGEASPTIRGLEVLEPRSDGGGNPLKLAWEAAVGLVGQVAELVSPGENQITADLPIHGEFGGRPALPTVVELLPKAWFGALIRAARVGSEAGEEAIRGAVEGGQAVEGERADRDRRPRKRKE